MPGKNGRHHLKPRLPDGDELPRHHLAQGIELAHERNEGKGYEAEVDVGVLILLAKSEFLCQPLDPVVYLHLH